MPPGAPRIHDDIIDAVIEDEIQSGVADARERQEACDEDDYPSTVAEFIAS